MRFLAVALVIVGCGAPPDRVPGDPDAGPQGFHFARTFAAVHLEAGQERNDLCASWTLDNTDKLFVNRVAMSSGPGWHHSNWFYVDDTMFTGPDGIWPCSERGFDVVSVAVGGGTLFAQSTQAQSEVQSFNAGEALRLPRKVKVVGQLHLLNAGDAAIDTPLSLEVDSIPEQEVVTTLQPMAVQYSSLQILPRQSSSFTTDCDLRPQLDGQPIDFKIHYVLPHYHSLGVGASIERIGGDQDGTPVFSSNAPVGEAWGQRMDPPVDLNHATGLRFRCDFDNPRSETVGYGVGDQEMCIIFAFTSSSLRWIGDVQSSHLESNDGTLAENRGECAIFALPPWI